MSKANRTIGFDRKVQLDWLEATAGWVADGLSPAEIRSRLDEILAGKVAGEGPHSAKGKTKTVLLHIWVLVPDNLITLRDEGIAFSRGLAASAHLALHWGMCMATYPFFREVAATTGRLLNVQGTAALSQIRRRMVETWGERSTLPRAVARVVRSFVDWGVIRETTDRGVFAAAPKIGTKERNSVEAWLVKACLSNGEKDMVSLRQLAADPSLFPFRLSLKPRHLRSSPSLEVIRQALDEDYVRLRDWVDEI